MLLHYISTAQNMYVFMQYKSFLSDLRLVVLFLFSIQDANHKISELSRKIVRAMLLLN